MTLVPRFDHLLRLSDDVGVVEHALLDRPRTESGYCVDDAARALVVALREESLAAPVEGLARVCLDFLVAAQAPDGRIRNRRAATGAQWEDEPALEDAWGRALWALGEVVARRPDLACGALQAFERSAVQRPGALRPLAFAALGAGAVLSVEPRHVPSMALLADAAAALGPGPAPRESWPWPEERLTYANGVLAEALLVAGAGLGDDRVLERGLGRLAWLLATETVPGHVSVTPVGGWAPGEPRPGFDQQPIEPATLADACARAYALTGDPAWRRGVLACRDWFAGTNDGGRVMVDPATGAGYDGLEARGRNENRGAESTIAALSTLQHGVRLEGALP